jgi:hypothetical protein
LLQLQDALKKMIPQKFIQRTYIRVSNMVEFENFASDVAVKGTTTVTYPACSNETQNATGIADRDISRSTF